MNVTPTVNELDVRVKNQKVDVIRFADDYQNNDAGACRITREENGDVYIRNEGYSLVKLTSREQVNHLIAALKEAAQRAWF